MVLNQKAPHLGLQLIPVTEGALGKIGLSVASILIVWSIRTPASVCGYRISLVCLVGAHHSGRIARSPILLWDDRHRIPIIKARATPTGVCVAQPLETSSLHHHSQLLHLLQIKIHQTHDESCLAMERMKCERFQGQQKSLEYAAAVAETLKTWAG